MRDRTNKWGNQYDKQEDCKCDKSTPDEMFFGGYDLPDQKSKGIYCHCKFCGGIIWYERK